MHLFGKEGDGIGFTRALGMPEHPQLTGHVFTVPDRLDSTVNPEELVVTRHDLDQLAARVIEDGVVLKQIQQVGLAAHPLEQGLHVDHTRLILL